MKARRIDHIGIAVRKAEPVRDFYVGTMGLGMVGEEVLQDQKLRVVKVRCGEVILELLEPLDEERVISAFLERRGEGIHHVCFDVQDVEKTARELKAGGCRVLYEKARAGAMNRKVNFLHPSSAFGVLIEISQGLGNP
jgi:methylmalonyl-CoA epimerase